MTNGVASRNGSALVATMVWSAVLLALFVVIINFTSLTYTQASRETKVAQAISLGNGGLNHALAQFRVNGSYRGESYNMVSGTIDTFVETKSDSATITAQAYVPDKVSPSKICRAFRINVDASGVIIKKTYQELPQCDTSIMPPGPNAAPTLTIVEPDGVGDTYPNGTTIEIKINLNDPDNNVTARLYYDTDNSGFDGTAIAGTCAFVPEGTESTCDFMATVPAGIYYIYGTATDNSNPTARAYSSGPITITNRVPTLTISEPNGEGDAVVQGQNYTLAYNANDDNATGVAFFRDNDNQNFDGVAIPECNSSPISATGSCAFATPSIPLGSYYIYGVVNDGVNPAVQVYSAGQFTVTQTPPTLTISEPNGVVDTIGEQGSFTVTFTYTDPDPTGSVSFSYSTSSTGYSGTAMLGECASQTPSASGGDCVWSVDGLALSGTYYVYGITSNSQGQSVKTYAPGAITINRAPTLSLSNPNGTPASASGGSNIAVTGTLADADNSATIRVTLYYDTNDSGFDGTAVASGSCATPQSQGNFSCQWYTGGVPAGTYWVYGVTKDPYNPAVMTYSPSSITLTGPPPNQAPQVTVSEPDGNNDTVYKSSPTGFVTFNLKVTGTDADNPSIPIKLYYDSDTTGFDGTAMPSNCTQIVQGTNVTCSASMPPSLAFGTYFMYATMDDGVNPIVRSYSSGPFTYANKPPTLTITQPGNDTLIWATTEVTISYTSADSDDSSLTGGFYFDTDATGFNGTALTGDCAQLSVGSGAQCKFTPSSQSMGVGTYSIYGKSNDGNNPEVMVYAPGKLIIQSLPAPSLYISKPNAGANYLQDRIIPKNGVAALRADGGAGTQTVTFYRDSNDSGFDGTALSGCTSVTKGGSGYLCTWATTGLELGSYYIYAIASGDPLYPTVTSNYGSAPIEIRPQCNDLRDNDNDGKIDFEGATNDSDCTDTADDNESPDVSIDHVNAITQDTAGNVYSVGSRQWNNNDTDLVIRKTLANGSSDTSFGSNGFVVYHDTIVTTTRSQESATDVAIGSDNKLYVVGTRTTTSASRNGFFIRRYSLTGTLDTTFGGTHPINPIAGMADFTITNLTEPKYSIALISSGDIYIAGSIGAPNAWSPTRMAVWKFNSVGKLYDGVAASPAWGDAATPGFVTYGDTTKYRYQGNALVVDSSSNAFVIGGAIPVSSGNPDIGMVTAKISSTGTLDTGFGTQGVVTYTHPKTDPPPGSPYFQERGISGYIQNNDIYVGIAAAYGYYLTPGNPSAGNNYGFVRKYRTIDGTLYNGVVAGPEWGTQGMISMASALPSSPSSIYIPTSLYVSTNNTLHIAARGHYAQVSSNGAFDTNQTYSWQTTTSSGAPVSESNYWFVPTVSQPNSLSDFAFAGDWTGSVPGSPAGTPTSINWQTIVSPPTTSLTGRSFYDSTIHHE